MRQPIDTPALTEVSRVLEGLSEVVAAVEDDLLSCLVVMGEPHAQQVVDAWIDHVVDLLRAVDEVTDQHLTTLARVSTRVSARRDDQSCDQASLQDSTPVDHQ